ncbi:MAG: hypothetical protein ABSA97_08090 [Verrucomicrobiia bacterium]
MGTNKHTTAGRNGATAGKAAPNRSGQATLKLRKLSEFVKREEARGAYRDFPDPAEAVAELRRRAKKPRHALRTAAA